MTDTTARELGTRWLAALADHDLGPWRPGMRVLPVPDSDPEERDLESGMTTEPGDVATVVSTRGRCVTVAWETDAASAEGGTLLSDDVPDLRDPATIGAALGVLREVMGKPMLFLAPASDASWAVFYGLDLLGYLDEGATESEAIVCAAEAWAARGGVS